MRTFHAAQLGKTLKVETQPGVSCELVSRPLDAVGLYIPGGSAPLPSTVLMLGVPAQIAAQRVAAAAEAVAHEYATNGEDLRVDVILLAPGRMPQHIVNAWQP